MINLLQRLFGQTLKSSPVRWGLVALLWGCASLRADPLVCRGADHTACWRQALAAAVVDPEAPQFAGVLGTPGATYVITDTLTIESVYGGVIDGNGSVLRWQGRPDRPLFLIKNTQQLRFSNLRIIVDAPLETAFEFTKAPYGRNAERNVAPSLNVLDGVRVDGVKLGNLQYGVRFSKRYGIDEDNDQSTIMNTAIYNVTEAAISIEHTQSQAHHFYAVKASGAPGNQNAAFVRAVGGSFTSLGGFHGRFGGAVYDLTSANGTNLIIDEGSEASARFIRTPDGAASFALPVHVIGGRFSVDQLAPDGRIVDFNRMGPLSIRGLKIDGPVPKGAANPVISFWPQPAGARAHGQLAVSDVAFTIPGSKTWELLRVSAFAHVNSSGNTCVDAAGAVAHCQGLAAGVTAAAGVTFGALSAGALKALPPGHTTYCEDCAVEAKSGLCATGGTGRFAKKLPGGWYCD